MSFVFRPVVVRRRRGQKVRQRTRYYWACYRDPVDGRTRRVALKLPSGAGVTSREVAEATLRGLLEQRQRLAAGLTNQYIESAGMPTAKLVAGFLRHLRRKRIKGRPLSRQYLRQALQVGRWIIARGAGRIGELTTERIDAALGTLTALGRSPKTVTAYRMLLHGLCEYGVKIAGVLESNPVARIRSHGVNPTKVRRALTPDEAARLLETVRSVRGGAPRALFYEAALYTGLRVGELAALVWGDLDLDVTPKIRLRATTTKAGRADTLPLRRDLADKLRALRPADASPSARVFPVVPSWRTFLRDCHRAGLRRRDDRGRTLDRHALRTTFVTWLSMTGTAPRTAQKLARHTSIDLTMRHYTDEALLDGVVAVENLPDLLPAAGSEQESALSTGTHGAERGVVLPVVLNLRESRGIEGNLPRTAAAHSPQPAGQDPPEFPKIPADSASCASVRRTDAERKETMPPGIEPGRLHRAVAVADGHRAQRALTVVQRVGPVLRRGDHVAVTVHPLGRRAAPDLRRSQALLARVERYAGNLVHLDRGDDLGCGPVIRGRYVKPQIPRVVVEIRRPAVAVVHRHEAMQDGRLRRGCPKQHGGRNNKPVHGFPNSCTIGLFEPQRPSAQPARARSTRRG
jgi:integrase/recombinase XerD